MAAKQKSKIRTRIKDAAGVALTASRARAAQLKQHIKAAKKELREVRRQIKAAKKEVRKRLNATRAEAAKRLARMKALARNKRAVVAEAVARKPTRAKRTATPATLATKSTVTTSATRKATRNRPARGKAAVKKATPRPTSAPTRIERVSFRQASRRSIAATPAPKAKPELPRAAPALTKPPIAALTAATAPANRSG